MAHQHVYGTLVTMTAYGTWLRGDARGWVEDGRIFPADPELEAADRASMTHPPYRFDPQRLLDIGAAIGKSLQERLQQRILALTVQTWHVHFVVSESDKPISQVVKCAKDAVRYHLRAGRPLWTENCDKRFCFDERSLRNRIRYVERHNIESGWPPRPWPFIIPLDS